MYNDRNKKRPQGQSRNVQLYRQNVKKLNELCKYEKDMKLNFGERGSSTLKNGFRSMTRHMDCLIEGGTVEVKPDELQLIRRSLELVIDIIIEKPITDYVKDFSLEYGRLSFNWAKDACKCQDIMRYSQTVSRIVSSHLTIVDSIYVMRKLNDKLRREINYGPPGFEASRHYLEVSRKEREKDD